MRISDWSSDVCSSDLFNETLDRQWFLKAHRLGVRTRIIGKHSVRRCADFESKLDGFVIFNGAEPQFRHRISPAGWRIRSRVTITRSGYPGRIVIVGGMLISCWTSLRPAIGRASCRERVCQYV